jgi:hypothetical protein
LPRERKPAPFTADDAVGEAVEQGADGGCIDLVHKDVGEALDENEPDHAGRCNAGEEARDDKDGQDRFAVGAKQDHQPRGQEGNGRDIAAGALAKR